MRTLHGVFLHISELTLHYFPLPLSHSRSVGSMRTKAKFSSPDVFHWEKHMRSKEGCVYDLDYKRIPINSVLVVHGRQGDREQRLRGMGLTQ